MINIFRNKSLTKRSGIVSMFIAVVLLVAVTLTLITSTESTTVQHRTSANQLVSIEAREAAEAGSSFGVTYFNKMKDTILASTTDGYIDPYSDSNTAKTLSNGSSYVITYTNPVQNDYTLILVTAVGTSANGQTTKTITQQIKKTGSSNILTNITQGAVGIKNRFKLENNSRVINNTSDISSEMGADMDFSDNGLTQLLSYSSSQSLGINGDIIENNSNLNGSSSDELFESLFGKTKNEMKNQADVVVTGEESEENLTSTINGLEGQIIWLENVDNKIKLDDPITLGSTDNPVILIVKSKEFITEDFVNIYGLVVIIGQGKKVEIKQDTYIEGALIVLGTDPNPGQVKLKDRTLIELKDDGMSERISNLAAGSGGDGSYSPVAGSWSDF